ncbi:MAG: hypothetical protein AAB531_03835 [Patescibacteria group bacterium]
MGKIRVKTFGSPEEEAEDKKKTEQKREAKKMAKGAHGGERVVSLGVTEEEIAKEMEASQAPQEEEKPSSAKASKGKKEKFAKKKIRSKRYQSSAINLDRTKIYSLKEALELLGKFQKTKFDETIELHINTARGGISGNITLPHGSGKITRVAVADDNLIAEIESGKINFDILVAEPSMMPKLAKVAKVLGPRGLMPNPKNGTITAKPQEVVKKFEAGQMSYKTEAKAPLIHMVVGKFSFGETKLADNIKMVFSTIKPENIQQVTLKSTMSPGIKISI